MIKKFIYGKPFDTGAVVENVPASDGKLPFFNIGPDGEFVYCLDGGDIVYGLGQQVRGLNKRGWKYTSWNLDNPSHQEDTQSLYGAHNFLLISGTELFGVFFDYGGKIDFDIGFTDRRRLSVKAEGNDLTVYIITADSELHIVNEFRRLIGRSYIAPKWALGMGQSRWGYKNAEDIRAVAEGYRSNNIPLDMIYLDIDYMERFKDFSVDSSAFPDFKGLFEEMREQGIRLIPIIDAGVKIEEGYNVYEEGVRNNYFCKDKDGNDFIAAVWPGRVHFPDFLNSETRRWFGDKYSVLIEYGAEGFWNDMNEPAIFYTDGRLKDVLKRVNELGSGNMGIYDYFEFTGSVNGLSNNFEDYSLFSHNADGVKIGHEKVHNLYGFYMTRAASEAFERLCPDKRILMFSRSSYIGAHRYGGMWQGDNRSWWSHLLMNIQMTASLNMVGFLYTGADMGGFNCDVTEDLLLRWLQFSVFTPLMRNHSALGTREQELYRFGNMAACRSMTEIRYGLLPYIYSEYVKAALRDEMMFKPLGFEFKDSVSKGVEDQLLFGNELMLAPVYTQNAEGRYVWLPEEMMMIRMRSLTEYETEILPAGHHYISVPLDELVFFVRYKKAFPFCSGGQHTGDIDMSTVRLVGYNDAEYELYDDDGVTKDISESNIRIIR